MTDRVRATRVRRGTYVMITDAGGGHVYLPVYHKSRRDGLIHVRGRSSTSPAWSFRPDELVEVLTADEESGLGLPSCRRWWQI